MNKRLLSVALIFSCVAVLSAQTTIDSQGESEISGKLPKRKVLDLRKKHKHTIDQAETMPVIASPLYMQQAEGSGTAITANNGFLYVVVGQKLYKVSEKTLRTVEVAQLGRMQELASSRPTKAKRHRKKVKESA